MKPEWRALDVYDELQSIHTAILGNRICHMTMIMRQFTHVRYERGTNNQFIDMANSNGIAQPQPLNNKRLIPSSQQPFMRSTARRPLEQQEQQ